MIGTVVVDDAVTVEAKVLHQVVMNLHHVEETIHPLVVVEAGHHHVVDLLLLLEIEAL